MEIDFSKLNGLAPAIVQDVATREVLMVAFMNEEAWRETVSSGFATFYSRSRGALWRKGETSGHRLAVREARTDCDQDAILLLVEPEGPGVCHEGYRACFFRTLERGSWRSAEGRTFDPDQVYA